MTKANHAYIDRLSGLTGVSKSEILRTADRLEMQDDLLLAAWYAHATGLAINVRSDRHLWNLNHARRRANATRDHIKP